ncbi:MAG: phage terminase large subunit, partial [Brevinema sp.]
YQAVIISKSGKSKSLWETRFPLRFLQKQKNIMGISAFNSEYQNMPTDEEYSLFKESYIKEGRIEENSPKVIFIDPSVDGIKNNDFKAGILVAKDKEGIFEIVDAVLIQGSDLSFFEQIVGMYQKYHHHILGTYIENNSFQLYYMKDLDHFAKQQGVDLRLSGVKQYQKKELRISRLLPIFETNRILFNPQFINTKAGKILIEQLLYFPNSTVHDDAPDALAGAIDILNQMNQKIENNSYQVIPKNTKQWYKESSW